MNDKEQTYPIVRCDCEFGLFVPPFAYDTLLLNRIKMTTTILCTCCGEKVTRFTRKGVAKAWNKKMLKNRQSQNYEKI